ALGGVLVDRRRSGSRKVPRAYPPLPDVRHAHHGEPPGGWRRMDGDGVNGDGMNGDGVTERVTGQELKRPRQRAIRQLIASRPIGSQRELVDALTVQGFDVTQATVSRDIA